MSTVMYYFRKYRLWLAAGLIILAILYSLLLRTSRDQAPTTPASPSPLVSPAPGSPAPALSPLAPSPEPEEITITGLLFPSFDFNTQTIYYYSDTDSVFKKRTVTDGRETILSPEIVFLNRAVWSPNKKLVLIELENRKAEGSDNRYYQESVAEGFTILGLLNLETRRFIRLNSGIIDYAFINDDEIIYQYKDEKNNNLSVAKPDGSNWKNLTKLSGDIDLLGLEGSAVVQVLGEERVVRYGVGGKRLEQYSVPADFVLDQASWATTGRSAIYWVREGQQVVIKQIENSESQTLYRLDTQAAQLVILWDNKTGAIYLASFDGLIKLPVSARP